MSVLPGDNAFVSNPDAADVASRGPEPLPQQRNHQQAQKLGDEQHPSDSVELPGQSSIEPGKREAKNARALARQAVEDEKRRRRDEASEARNHKRLAKIAKAGELHRFGVWLVSEDGSLHCAAHASCTIEARDLRAEIELKSKADKASLLQRDGARARYEKAYSLNRSRIRANHKFDRAGSLDLMRALQRSFKQLKAQPVESPKRPMDLREAITPRMRFQVLQRDQFRCQLCGRDASDGVKLEVDHSHPASRGGAATVENLWTLCFDCNRGKSAGDLLGD